jgi:hypothetical protein
MGRTIPSFRLASVKEEKEWKEFRKQLDKSDRKVLDRVFATAHLYNSASSYAAIRIRIQPTLMSVTFHHYKQLKMLSESIKNTDGLNKQLI